MKPSIHSTTVIAVRRDGKAAIGSDGQVSAGNTVLKSDARKIRRLHEGNVLVGFAGATADAMALMEKFDAELKKWQGNLLKASIELAKLWRTDRMLRRLECMMIALDKEKTLLLSGSGDVIEPEDGVIAVGSGGPFATAAARALMSHSKLAARDIVQESLKIAAGICVYTNDRIVIEEL